jgi:threonine/homoserine/homoserine lactone efflux protein
MLANTLILLTVCTLGLLSPGPDMMLILKNSLTRHRSAALATVWGISAAIVIHMTYCVLGLGFLLMRHPQIFKMVQYAGAAYLIYIGVRALTAIVPTSGQLDKTASRSGRRLGFAQGFWCNLLNPKAAFFFMALFTQMLSPQLGLQERVFYAMVVILHSFIMWTLLVLLLQARAVQQAVMRSRVVVERIFGGLLVALGIKVALTR